eukprot:3587102-Pyramimonas_sp.AAC.1
MAFCSSSGRSKQWNGRLVNAPEAHKTAGTCAKWLNTCSPPPRQLCEGLLGALLELPWDPVRPEHEWNIE